VVVYFPSSIFCASFAGCNANFLFNFKDWLQMVNNIRENADLLSLVYE